LLQRKINHYPMQNKTRIPLKKICRVPVGVLLVFSVLFAAASCKNSKEGKKEIKMEIKKEVVGQVDGKDVMGYTLTNDRGMTARIISYGAIVTHLIVPDKEGNFEDVVLGFSDAESYWTEPYLSNCCYLGAIVGRYGNRIAGGKFTIDGKEYQLAINNGPNHLHGGIKGFDKVVWDSDAYETENGPAVKLTYLSPDGEEGYPGNFNIEVIYTLTHDNELQIDYHGTIDKNCPVNITHHGYFNLSGHARRDILNHEVEIFAHRYTVVDETLIPTGELRPVYGTPMNFTEPHTIGSRINEVEGGYDHNYVASKPEDEYGIIARVREPVSGRIMEVYTGEPGVQFYTGNFLDGTIVGKGNIKYNKNWGFCLETQHFPDSPNQPEFPTVLLTPGAEYGYRTVYRFLTD
jgi:aldose 1-epimerase